MRRLLLGLIIGATACVGSAAAQPYPSRPVTMIVPFGAGGPVDTVARSVSEAIRALLGQPILIENVTGASGTRYIADYLTSFRISPRIADGRDPRQH